MDLSTELCAATATGILAHHGLFIHGEWHMQAPSILLTHIAAFNVFWMTSMELRHATVLEAMAEAMLVSACYLASLYSSRLIYRLIFHRLREIPGPVLARSTKLWHAWKCRHSQNHLVLDQLYHRYGDFVRTGELSALNLNLNLLLCRSK